MDRMFVRTAHQVRFNGRTRPIHEGTFTWYPPGQRAQTVGPVFLILDEWHGDVEVCEHRVKRGKVQHIGSLQLDADDAGIVSVGEYHSPAKKAHTFVLI